MSTGAQAVGAVALRLIRESALGLWGIHKQRLRCLAGVDEVDAGRRLDQSDRLVDELDAPAAAPRLG